MIPLDRNLPMDEDEAMGEQSDTDSAAFALDDDDHEPPSISEPVSDSADADGDEEDDVRKNDEEEDSSGKDGSYNPNQAQASGVQDSTPQSRARGHISQETKDRLASKVGDEAFRCLLTREYVPKPEYAHIVARSESKNGVPLKNLEYVLGLKTHEFNVHSTSNLLYLSPNVHYLFDQDWWGLLPSTDDLKTMRQHLRSVGDPQTDPSKSIFLPYTNAFSSGKTFEYRFIPLLWLDARSLIHRRIDIGHAVQRQYQIEPEYMAYDPHEFSKFPRLMSHVNPFLVAVNTGDKLVKTALVRYQNRLATACPAWDEDISTLLLIHSTLRYTKPTPEWHTAVNIAQADGNDDKSSGEGQSSPSARRPKRSRGQSKSKGPQRNLEDQRGQSRTHSPGASLKPGGSNTKSIRGGSNAGSASQGSGSRKSQRRSGNDKLRTRPERSPDVFESGANAGRDHASRRDHV
ncbi:hypothetical protein EIP91_005313 [Steccherinum ochraceum]|uniref:HNH nuclease domain-containing protein n=1 Tax=Steccherinum ochraceum TaxID=92696 RepID=A0A4R0R7L6_9APHY|nr:hypothetical protein EIP91_005313 [Steccherinum ochraceum]